jgi:hypothetical protein
MTLGDFTILRRDELLAFFRARYGRPWRKIVARQANMHPRCFERWKGVPPLSIFRQILRLEAWARSVGFSSATDVEVQAALREHKQFVEAAEQEVVTAQSKRNYRLSGAEDLEQHRIKLEMEAAIRRMRAGGS